MLIVAVGLLAIAGTDARGQQPPPDLKAPTDPKTSTDPKTATAPPAPAADAAVVALIAKLYSKDESDRLQAIKALKMLGPKAQLARSALAKIADADPDADVRLLAKSALKEIASAASEPTDARALVEKLQSPDASVRLGAIKALKALGSEAKEAVPTLLRLADYDLDEDVRKLANDVLQSATAANVAEEIVKTDARAATVRELIATQRLYLSCFGRIRADQSRKLAEASKGPTPDLAQALLSQNSVAVNSEKIVIVEQTVAKFEVELAELEKYRAFLEKSAKKKAP